MNRKFIDYKELAKQKKQEAYMKAISKLPIHLRPQPSTQKTRARVKVRLAKKSGKLIMQSCRVCGELKTEAHHPDYSKPLDVVWLCKQHHIQEHFPQAEKKEYTIKQPRYTESQIIGNVSNIIKNKKVINAFIKRRTPKSQW